MVDDILSSMMKLEKPPESESRCKLARSLTPCEVRSEDVS